MTKNEKFKLLLDNAIHNFVNSDNAQCLNSLRKAGDIVLAEIKEDTEKTEEKNNQKIL